MEISSMSERILAVRQSKTQLDISMAVLKNAAELDQRLAQLIEDAAKNAAQSTQGGVDIYV